MFSSPLQCILCSDDGEFVESITGYLGDLFTFSYAESTTEALERLERRRNCIVIVDLHLDQSIPLIAALARRKPSCLTIALGDPHSAPFREAAKLNIFAVFDANSSGSALQSVMERAAAHLALIAENQALKLQLSETQGKVRSALDLPPLESGLGRIDVIQNVLTDLREPFSVLDRVLDEIARQFLPTSISLFVGNSGGYALRSGLRCAEEAWNARFSASDAFVRWMKTHGKMISRSSLEFEADPENKLALEQALDVFGAELVIPITVHSALRGWITFGPKVNGGTYERDDQNLFQIVDRLGKIIEALTTIDEGIQQQSLLAGMTNSFPSGLIMVDGDFSVTWANDEARRLLKLDLKRGSWAIDQINPRLADVVRRASESNGRLIGGESESPHGARLSMTGRFLETVGVMVLVEEIPTHLGGQKITLNDAMDSLPGSDLAFKIRTSLSAIRSFCQLVSERHEDPNFLATFGSMVNSEIDTLVQISEHLPRFSER